MVIQYLLLAAFAVALALTWRRAGQNAISRMTALAWSALWITAAVVVLRPETASALARVLGVGRGVDVVIYVAIVAIFYLIFRLFMRLETLERQLTKLVREIALRDAKDKTP